MRSIRDSYISASLRKIFVIILLGSLWSFGFLLQGCSKNEAQTESGVTETKEVTEVTEVTETEVQQLKTPDYRGNTLEEAQTRYTQAGFTGEITTHYNRKCSHINMPGLIYQQEPSPGITLASNTNLTLSHGCFNLTTIPGSGGTISPPGITDVKAYSLMTFTVIPDNDYFVTVVQLDGTTIDQTANQHYILERVNKDHVVSATFCDNAGTLCISNDGGSDSDTTTTTSYTITSSVQAGNCEINPSGSVSVSENDDQTFTITVNSGLVGLLEVDDNAVDCDTSGCNYTFTGVTSDHSIKVTCL